MANISQIKLPSNTVYTIKDSNALPLTGGTVTGPVTFGDSVTIDGATIGDLIVNGSGSFTNNLQANTINSVTVGSTPKFTDTVTTVTTSGSGNAITAISATNGAITATKGSTFLTSSDISGKIDTAGTGLSKSGTTLNHSNSVTAQTTQAVYPIKIDAQGHISAYGNAATIPSITLNGSATTSPSFYAPTTAGTSGYFLKSNGSGAPTWASITLTDTKVTQTPEYSTDNEFAVLLEGTAGSSTATEGVKKASGHEDKFGIKYNPYYDELGVQNLTVGYNLYGSYVYATAIRTDDIQTSALNFSIEDEQENIYTAEFDLSQIANNTITLPGNTGTLALTDQLPVGISDNTTGISVADHSTTTIYGVSSSTTSVTGVSGSTSVYGVKSSTTTASKASGSNGTASSWTFEEKSIPNVTAAGSGSFTQGSFSGGSLTMSINANDSSQLDIVFTAATHGSDTHVHTAPTLGTAIKVQSKSGGSNGTADTWSFSDVTVPIRADSATTVPTAASSATTVPIKNSSSTTVVTSKTHSVTDNGHTHSLT